MMGESDLRQEMQGMFEALSEEFQREEERRRRQEAEREELRRLHREILRSELESFFGFLGPTLSAGVAAVRVMEERARAAEERRTARKFTAFGLVRTQELDLSRIFRGLLDPAGDHGQGELFLSLLLEELHAGSPDAAEQLRLFRARRAQAHLEYATGQQETSSGGTVGGSIDIVLELEDNHWIGIENKPWAVDQPEQVERYRRALLDKAKGDEKRVVVLYWSGDGSGPILSDGEDIAESGDRSATGQQQKRTPSCITMPYRKRFGAPSLEGWLKRCWVECEAERVRSFVGDLLDYLRSHFRSAPTG